MEVGQKKPPNNHSSPSTSPSCQGHVLVFSFSRRPEDRILRIRRAFSSLEDFFSEAKVSVQYFAVWATKTAKTWGPKKTVAQNRSVFTPFCFFTVLVFRFLPLTEDIYVSQQGTDLHQHFNSCHLTCPQETKCVLHQCSTWTKSSLLCLYISATLWVVKSQQVEVVKTEDVAEQNCKAILLHATSPLPLHLADHQVRERTAMPAAIVGK